ncbi:NAD(P)-dependent alcohol dehydrogenase [Zunongwangia endophytica]|uniref:NAD(P)-dependent alcohol dehydrogenase n=1 Tax=Zunongwangia endophytica TaxID=1808945 RepID=A0ABV8H4Y8_9FLAO|nr:NAD(P)-dependent alcohol dehydrogenase [Zunongwangia endophytica]MDN3595566.1 NAD(P)-dependent alcohol dehydrogenase [Zunongwangia endophytica]
MKAIAYNQFGTSEVLHIVEQSKPSVKNDQVLIKVKTFSINSMDWKIRKGEMKLMSGSKFPKHTGADFAGIVEEVGSGVNHLKKGDEVFGVVKNLMKEGASAEYVAVSASLVWKKPAAISFAQAASIPVVGTAALSALEKMGNITPQSSILVNGATGGFGMFLLQLLQQKNANISAVASTKGLAFAKKWGANKVIDYSKENVFSKQTKYDVVIDLSGKMSYKNGKKLLKNRGSFLNVTPQPIQIIASLFNNLFTSKKHIVVLSNPSTKQTEKLIKAVNEGLQIEVNKVFPFNQFKEAYKYAEKGGVIGKVVVEINE